jgi:WD40 repeat protein
MDGTLRFWCLKTGKLKSVVEKLGGRPVSLQFLDNQKLAVKLPGEAPRICDVLEKDPKFADLPVKTDRPCHVAAFSASGNMLALGSNPSNPSDDRLTGSILLFTTNPFRQSTFLPGNYSEVRSIALDSAARNLAAGKDNHTIDLWSLSEKKRIVLKGHQEEVFCLSFSSMDSVLASASYDGVIKLWHVSRGGQELVTLEGHKAAVFGMAFTPDGKKLVTCGLDKQVAVWNLVDLLPRSSRDR